MWQICGSRTCLLETPSQHKVLCVAFFSQPTATEPHPHRQVHQSVHVAHIHTFGWDSRSLARTIFRAWVEDKLYPVRADGRHCIPCVE